MKKYLSLIFLSFISCQISFAQRTCASVMNLDSIEKYNSDRYHRIIKLEKNLEEYNNKALTEKTSYSIPNIIRIPVVVHVLHNGESIGTGLNISMAQIESQIDVLNEDYRRLNADATNTPLGFQSVAADAGIEFYLACVDPDGNPTNGVVRKQGKGSYTVVQTGTEIDEVTTGIKLGVMVLPLGQPVDI